MALQSILIAIFATVCLASGQSCGKSSVAMRPNPRADHRIVGGVEANAHSHPWIISLQRLKKHKCGGSVIRVSNKDESDIVITAAHCLKIEDKYYDVVTGAHNLSNAEPGQERVAVAKIVKHPQYENFVNDIAVLKLAKPIKFTDIVQPVCLPSEGEIVPDNMEGTVAGWGVGFEDGQFRLSSILVQVGLPVVNSEICKHNGTKLNPPLIIWPKEMICAGFGAGGKDACQGDSGGPFVFPSKQGYMLQGVVSFGSGCAKPGMPGMYTRVSTYVQWIKDQVKLLTDVDNA